MLIFYVNEWFCIICRNLAGLCPLLYSIWHIAFFHVFSRLFFLVKIVGTCIECGASVTYTDILSVYRFHAYAVVDVGSNGWGWSWGGSSSTCWGETKKRKNE